MAEDQHLQQARRVLEDVVGRADSTVRDDLRDLAGELATIEQDDRPVDHAVVDGYLNQLRQAKRETDADIEDEIDDVIEALSAYREELQGA